MKAGPSVQQSEFLKIFGQPSKSSKLNRIWPFVKTNYFGLFPIKWLYQSPRFDFQRFSKLSFISLVKVRMSERAENVAVNKLGKKTELALVFWLSIRLTWWIKKREPFAVYFLKLSSSLNLCSVCPLSLLHSAVVDNDNGNDDDDDDDDKDVNDRDDDGDSDMIMMTILKWWLGLLY